MINSLYELTTEKYFLDENLESFENEKIALTIQISELGEKFT